MNEILKALHAEFAQPAAAFRPAIFWIWNGPITAQGIDEQVAEFADRGLGGFVIHPISKRFRGGTLFGGVEPDYLSDEYFALVRHAAEAARRHGLYLWLYDEGGWPSGDAQGKVMEGHPEFYGQVLTVRAVPVSEATVWCEGCVCAVAVMEDHSTRLLEQRPAAPLSPPQGATHICFFVPERVLPRVETADHTADTLNPACVRRFIELTHERYAQFCGEFFGETIPGIFTDEAKHPGQLVSGQIPYTEGILDSFRQRRGFDIRPYLPLLFSPGALGLDLAAHWDAQTVAAMRCEYARHVVELFSEAFWQQITRWCEAHGLIHTGHAGGEDNLPDHIRGRFSDIFRTVGELSAPGVDAIWRQIWPGERTFCFPLFAASAAHLKPGQGGPAGTPWDNLVTSETYAVYGYGLDFTQMRYVADYQYLFGVNMLMPMLVQWATERGKYLGTFAHIGRGNPLWEHYEHFADYIGRLSAVMRRGVALADIALYYPIEAFWADPEGPAASATWACLQSLTRLLQASQTPFDFVSAEALCRAEVEEGTLATPGQIYTTVVVPATPVLPVMVAEKLFELHRAGGRVCFFGDPPTLCSDWGEQERFQQAMSELLRDAWWMSAVSEDERSAESYGGLLETAPTWDGLSAAFAGRARGPDDFLPQEIRRDAVLVASEEQWFKLSRVLAATAGPYGLRAVEFTAELLLASRPIGDLLIHLALNTSHQTLDAELAIVSEEPLALERWDAASGAVTELAVHEEVTEGTRFHLRLPALGSALLVACPLETDAAPAELPPDEPETLPEDRERHRGLHPVVAAWNAADSLEFEESFEIVEGTIVATQSEQPALQGPVPLVPWQDLGFPDFSGTVAYHFAMTISKEYVRDGSTLRVELTEVRHVAQIWVNGEYAGAILWEPNSVDISDLIQPGPNELVIRVTNTLANQVTRPDVIAQSRANGWMPEGYFAKCEQWMREARRSGLIGEVRVSLD